VKRSTRARVTGAVVALLAGAAGWWLFLRGDDAMPQGEIIEVTRGDLVETASATGSIEPKVLVEVKSRASGEVIEVRVQEGETVEAGQLLFRLDPVDADRAIVEAKAVEERARAELAQAQASLTVAEAEARERKAQHAVSARGTEMGLVAAESTRTSATTAEVAEANVSLRRAAIQASRAQLAAAQLAVQQAERRRAETDIVAPISGTILDVQVERGSIVASAVTTVGGGTPLATLADLRDLRVIGAIDEAQIGKVKPGQRAILRVSAHPDREFDGEVIRVSPLGKTATNVVTFDVEIVITDEAAHLLRSGMSADLEIITRLIENAVLLPLVAIESAGPKRFARLPDGERQLLRTGPNDGAHIVVLEGLEAGDRVMVGGVSEPPAPGAQRRPSGVVGMPRGRRP
jgi:HlyD family secretion protein